MQDIAGKQDDRRSAAGTSQPRGTGSGDPSDNGTGTPEAERPLEESDIVPDTGDANAYGIGHPETGAAGDHAMSRDTGSAPDYGAGTPEAGYPTNST